MKSLTAIQKGIRNILVGFGLAAMATAVALYVYEQNQVTAMDTSLLLKNLLGSMGFGAYCGLIALIYDWKRLSLLLQTAIHLPLLILGFYMTGISLGWFSLSYKMIGPLLSFLVIYLFIWSYFFFYNWLLAKRLNSELRKK